MLPGAGSRGRGPGAGGRELGAGGAGSQEAEGWRFEPGDCKFGVEIDNLNP